MYGALPLRAVLHPQPFALLLANPLIAVLPPAVLAATLGSRVKTGPSDGARFG